VKLATASWRWRIVLPLCAAVALGLALMIGPSMMPAATPPPVQSAHPSPPAANLAIRQVSATAQPVALTQTPASVKPVDRADAGDSPDLARLRARGLVIPLPAVSAAQLSDTYTQARSGGTAHEALDIMAPRGTPVLAVDDGRVAKLFLSKPGGITLYQFDVDGEYAYYYAHLDRYADGILEGDHVRRGQLIGHVGSTGNALPDAPHLHFAVFRLGPERQWWRGTPINPFLIWRSAKP